MGKRFLASVANVELFEKKNGILTHFASAKTLTDSAFGFTLRVPEDAVLGDHSRENAELGGNALYAGSASGRVQVRVRSLLRAWPSMACAALAPSSRRSMSCIFISMRL